jgi:hypothetical protein
MSFHEEVEAMTKLFAVCCCIAMFAGFAVPTSAQEQQQPLRLTQTIPLPGVKGRLDHMGVDLEKRRLFVAAVTNNTLEVVDLTGGKVINSLAGFKDAQDALFLGSDFNKLYATSLDGHVRVSKATPSGWFRTSKSSASKACSSGGCRFALSASALVSADPRRAPNAVNCSKDQSAQRPSVSVNALSDVNRL